MSRLNKYRAFTPRENFILFLSKIGFQFSKDDFCFNDLTLYYKAVNKFISNGYSINRINESYLEILIKKERYLIRRHGSDLKVFEQIVIDGEYSHLFNLIKKLGMVDSSLTIVDCGSNVGLFSAWILNRSKVEKIISIEADKENYSFQKKFINSEKFKSKITLLNKAIWSDSNSVLGISSEFRDGLQWAKSVVPVSDLNQETVNSISLNKILDDFTDQQVHILKIDIEGAEKVVFENLDSCDRMLKNAKIIALEIHRELDSTSKILKILQNYGFDLEQFGETTFGFKG